MGILLVTALERMGPLAEDVRRELGMELTVANGVESALCALRDHDFTIVVLDEATAECLTSAADVIWERSGLAVPLRANFAISSSARLVLEIRAALCRRKREMKLAMQAVSARMGEELRSSLAGLVLQTQLAASDRSLSPGSSKRLELIADLVLNLQRKIGLSLDTVHSLPVEAATLYVGDGEAAGGRLAPERAGGRAVQSIERSAGDARGQVAAEVFAG